MAALPDARGMCPESHHGGSEAWDEKYAVMVRCLKVIPFSW